MDYYKKLNTKSKTAVAEYKKLEAENTRLAAGDKYMNKALDAAQAKIDSLYEHLASCDKLLTSERLKNEALEMVGNDLYAAREEVKRLRTENKIQRHIIIHNRREADAFATAIDELTHELCNG